MIIVGGRLQYAASTAKHPSLSLKVWTWVTSLLFLAALAAIVWAWILKRMEARRRHLDDDAAES